MFCFASCCDFVSIMIACIFVDLVFFLVNWFLVIMVDV